MAGHSKWANIQYRKGVQDAKRGKIFTKLIREITVAARAGGGDPAHNPRLRHAIDKALGHNMPKDNIERAIKRGTGELDGANYEEIRYEGYGPGGVAVMVDCTTDNRTRTVGEVRHAFAKHGGNLGTDGSVAYLFKRVGTIHLAPGASEDQVMEAVLEAGAEDVIAAADGSIEVVTTPEALAAVRDALARAGLTPELTETVERAATAVAVAGEDAERVFKLIEVLEDLDDVQNVYTNADFADEFLVKHAG
jgi:YebC/PmpR family DNA-binding regulatory protein